MRFIEIIKNYFSTYSRNFSVIFMAVAAFSQAQAATQEHPAFLEPGERINTIIHGNIYAVEAQDKDYKTDRRFVVTKLYFPDGKTGRYKSYGVFPSASKSPDLRLEIFDSFLVLYPRYTEKGKRKKGVFVLDNRGNILWKDIKYGGGEVYWNGEKKRALYIYPYAGTLKIFSKDGLVILSQKYSNHAEPYFSDENSDEGPDFACNFEASRDGRFAAIERNSSYFHELTLLSIQGKVLFQKNKLPRRLSPLLVDDQKKVVLVVSFLRDSHTTYAGYDFSGSKLWGSDFQQQYYLKPDAKAGIVRVMPNSGGDENKSIDIRAGKIFEWR